MSFFLFFFNDTATTEIYTLSLHDALPISTRKRRTRSSVRSTPPSAAARHRTLDQPFDCRESRRPALGCPKRRDRKSTRLNSSHSQISYAVFCLKKKKIELQTRGQTRAKYT